MNLTTWGLTLAAKSPMSDEVAVSSPLKFLAASRKSEAELRKMWSSLESRYGSMALRIIVRI